MSDLMRVQEIIGSWNVNTFPKSTLGGHLNHIKKELIELEKAFTSGSDGAVQEEAADIFIMLIVVAYRVGFDILDVALQKFGELKNRRWCLPNEDGVIEHVRTAPGPFVHAHPADMPSDRLIMKGWL